MNTSKKITAKRIKEIKAFKTTDFSDTPILSKKQLQQFTPSHLAGMYKPLKKQIHVRLDMDIIEWLKKDGAGYQTRLNSILRKAMLSSKK